MDKKLTFITTLSTSYINLEYEDLTTKMGDDYFLKGISRNVRYE